MASAAQTTTADTLVTIKVNIDGVARRFKLPLRDVGINVLEDKVSLSVPPSTRARYLAIGMVVNGLLNSCGLR